MNLQQSSTELAQQFMQGARTESPGPALLDRPPQLTTGKTSECFQPSLYPLNSNHHCSSSNLTVIFLWL